MRGRGLGSVMGLALTCGLSVMTMRSCQSASPSSPANPSNLARNGVAGICANRQAVADAAAAGSGTPGDTDTADTDTADTDPAATVPTDLAAKLGRADPGVAAIVAQATTCPTDTTAP